MRPGVGWRPSGRPAGTVRSSPPAGRVRAAGLILSGGPASVYEPGAPVVDPQVFSMGAPILGICYGQQLMAQALGGRVEPTGLREYGRTRLMVNQADEPGPSVLLADLPAEE